VRECEVSDMASTVARRARNLFANGCADKLIGAGIFRPCR
jgi:hypothetical protein